MANKEHLSILKQGIAVWNEWKVQNPKVQVDLSNTNLSSADLSDAILTGVNLNGSDLSYADIIGANLSDASLTGTNFSYARVGYTKFGNNDLSKVRGLETVHHDGPSTIGIDTIYLSKGNIPESFLLGAGVPDIFITYMRSLTGTAIQFYSCFISYSSQDEAFAERLYADLQNVGVRCWFAPQSLKAGERFRERIDESIKLYDKLLLVLTKSSIHSDWVEKEVEVALDDERARGRMVLFPVRLDNAIMEISTGWPALIKNTRQIGDFRNWRNHDLYKRALSRLVKDLTLTVATESTDQERTK